MKSDSGSPPLFKDEAISGESANKQIAEIKTRTIKQKTAAWLAGVPASTLRDNAHEITPDSDGCYTIRQVCDWLIDQAKRDEDDSLPARKARLEVRRLENQVRDQDADFLLKSGQLIDRKYVSEKLFAVAQALRAAGETVARKKKLSGAEAQRIYNGAIEKLIREIKAGISP